VLIHSFSGNHLLGFPHKHILSGCCGRAGEDPLKHPPYTPHTCFTDSPGFRRMMQRDPALGIIREPRFQPNYVIKKEDPFSREAPITFLRYSNQKSWSWFRIISSKSSTSKRNKGVAHPVVNRERGENILANPQKTFCCKDKI